ncbi:hypothetical protein GQ457_03G038390 [Hibiscus cannabinus]
MNEEWQIQEQGERIFVSIRIRPLKDKARNRIRYWECLNNDTILFKHSLPERGMLPASYTFDRVFDSGCDTARVYEEGARHIALSVLEGINSSIFAYGQTSSGKTYTMRGITEYAVADIYDCIEKNGEREFSVKFCAMEIYNEAVRDLLSTDSYPLRVLDDPERGIVVEKLTEVTLRNREHLHELLAICEGETFSWTSICIRFLWGILFSVDDIIYALWYGFSSSKADRVGPSLTSVFNDAILQTIESCARQYAGARNSNILAASVNFVDLAGSERASQTLSAGARLKEGCHINRSLLTLGTVIRKLSKGRTGHIPYRDSKLTRILQNALGGNARTAIICTMSPERAHVEQSRNTLLFANCAKQVRTNAHVNLIMSDKALVKQLQRELARLEKEMRSLGSSTVKGDTAAVMKDKEQLIGQMTKEIEVLTWQRDCAQSQVENLLLSVKEVQMLKQPSEVTKAPCMVDEDDIYLELDEDPEEDFLLDGMTPKFFGPDPCKGWEISEKLDQEFEDSYKEVHSVEIEDLSNTMNEEEGKLTATEVLFQKTEVDEGDDFSHDPEKKQGKLDVIITTNDNVVSSPKTEYLQPSPVCNDKTYKGLKQKIHELQRTVNFLVNTQHQDQSPSFSDTSNSCSRNLCRSKSCRAVVTTELSSAYFEKVHPHDESTPPSAGVEKDFLEESRSIGLYQMLSEVKNENDNGGGETIPQRYSRTSSASSGSGETSSLKDLNMEDNNFLPRPWKSISDDAWGRISTSSVSTAGGSETKQSSEKQTDNKGGSEFEMEEIVKAESEFEEKQRKIVELWDACRVSLIHRSYFIQLFKGDPSDCLYLEIELRRLSHLKDATASSESEKELIRERGMLSKEIRGKHKKQREQLYKKWGIDLNTKQRSVRLAQLVWTDTKDMVHVKESAALIAEVLGFVEQGRTHNDGVGCILPPLLSRRSHRRLSLPFLF